MSRRRPPPRGARGLTLIEIVIGLGIAALMTSVAAVGLNALTDASLRSTSLELAGVIKHAYDRAIMQHRTQRLMLDLDKGVWALEFSENPFAVSKEKQRGDKGEAEASAAKEEDKSPWDEPKSEVEVLLEGGAPAFSPDAEVDGGRPSRLPGDVAIKRVWTSHQEEAFTSGTAYLYFWKSGMTEAALIELEDEGGDVVTLEVQPLTGRVKTSHKRVPVPELRDDDGQKDGDE